MRTEALLRLFNAVQVENKTNKGVMNFVQTLKDGYLLDPSIIPTDELLKTIGSIVGISGERANSSFHKSWSIVQNSSMELLVVEQMIHYLTTYGFEALSIYDESFVYFPLEALEIPELNLDDLKFVWIKAMTKKEVRERILVLASSGIALSQEAIDDIMAIVSENKYNKTFVKTVTNRELKAALCDFYGIVPTEPVEFLRHVISKLTDETLLIKNDYMIQRIKESNSKFLDELMRSAPKNLASIFYRYKPLFLAMKSISKNKAFYNRLRKDAVKMHKPLGKDYLNSITEQIKNNTLDVLKLEQKLSGASIFRKIRLAYALQYRTNPASSIVYTVRNGSGWADDFEWDNNKLAVVYEALTVVLKSIANDMQKKVNGKAIVIPENIFYALPATEKQFSGNYPSGSYISIPDNDLIVGIYWENLPNHRVDLDLSMLDADRKIGWDSSYRNSERSILFSGDVTDAQGGASELFYCKNGVGGSKMLDINYFNFSDKHPVMCKLIIASESPTEFGQNYMVNPNNIISTHQMKIDQRQNTLGVIKKVDNEMRFYFANVSTGKGITSRVNDAVKKSMAFYDAKLSNPIGLSSILEMAGAEIVNEVPVEDESGAIREFIDLSQPDKTTFVELLVK